MRADGDHDRLPEEGDLQSVGSFPREGRATGGARPTNIRSSCNF
jgi:hypothetical protein